MSAGILQVFVESTDMEKLWGENGANHGEMLSNRELSPKLRVLAAERLLWCGGVHQDNIDVFLGELKNLHDIYSAQYAVIDLLYVDRDMKKIEELHRYTKLHNEVFRLEALVLVH